MNPLIIALWLAYGLVISLAESPNLEGPDDLISWLQSEQELDVTTYNSAVEALVRFEHQDGLEADKDLLAAELIDSLALRRFTKLRNARDLPGTMEFFEEAYERTLKNKMITVISDEKDNEFSAQIVHHLLGTKGWAHPRAGFENVELRRKLFNKLAGEKSLERIGSDLTAEGQQAMKRALEEKWPLLLKEPVTTQVKKPPVQQVREDTGSSAYSNNRHPGNSGSTEDNGATTRLIVILALLAATFAVVFIYIKNHRSVRR